ncbi:hypothetical protein [Streptomyces misionensis]|uniref:hypothetical protein n=1 Tax=Streptomyces misionensis TaxID=67331 RepID=UPI0016476BAA|nr:hypothetical protein [Streptomyces misionensis]
MTVRTTQKPDVPVDETGWARTRGRRDRGVRTCLPAVLDRGTWRPGEDAEDTIVRGED